MRSRRMLLTLAVAGALAVNAGPAAAQVQKPSIADQPAATLLLPYFEVDLANPAGANTLFTINNASASAALAHVTVWSNMQVPVYAFNVYLTGFDMQTLNVRDVINGVLPQTASAGQDPSDTISPHGPVSQDINFASCTGQLPPAPTPQNTVNHIRTSLIGQQSPLTGKCASLNDGTQIAKGYITVDSVNNCTLRLPSDVGYIGGDLDNRNILWGDYVYTNHLGGLEAWDGSPMVAIMANATDPETSTPGQYTFYGRLTNWTAADNREPLSASFAARFVNNGAQYQTTLTVWRDAKINQQPFNCGSQPSWYPLGQEGLVFFDEQEHPEVQQSVPFAPQPPFGGPTPFPLAAQRVRVGGATLPTSFSFGWVYLNLNTSVAGQAGNEDPAAAQAWVEVHQKTTVGYNVGWPALMLDSAKGARHYTPGF